MNTSKMEAFLKRTYALEITKETLDRQSTIMNLLFRGQRKHHVVTEPIPQEQIDAQEAWLLKFNSLVDEGEEHGWVEWGFEGGWETAELQRERRITVYDETEEEWLERTRVEGDSVTFPVKSDRNAPPNTVLFMNRAEDFINDVKDIE